MDMRSWPWKRKSSEKTTAVGNSINQDNSKTAVTYVQVSEEKYAYLMGLDEKLSAALSDLTTKEDLVKQHTKIAEDAVSGWEKAEAETSALKSQLECVTLLKLTADDRAAHLDCALKECMQEVRNVKEEGEEKLHDVVFAKTRQWESIKSELESKIYAFEQELLQASAENDALMRTLREREDMLMKINDEKSRANDEIDVLKANIHSCEREISSLKYEVHVVTKELEIRNEEKNMSVRSADVANKQHLEDIKKIAKLESECQRLRGLVKKKLPGPATVAQMKLEVEGYGDSRVRRSPSKCLSPRVGLIPDFDLENMQQCHRENEFLSARLLGMEEENLMLKEALTRRNSELQASRTVFAKTASRLRNIETQTHGQDQQEKPSKYMCSPIGSFFSHNGSNAPSTTSMSEDGNDDGVFSTTSSATPILDGSHHRVARFSEDSNNGRISNQMDLMDDFLEMERLACAPPESNKQQANEVSSEQDGMSIEKLRDRISFVFDSHRKTGNLVKCCEDIRCILHDLEKELPNGADGCIIEEVKLPCDQENSNGLTFPMPATADDLRKAVATIHDFVGKIHSRKPQGVLEDKSVEAFSSIVSKFLSSESNERGVILALSHVLTEMNGVDMDISSKGSDEGSITSDCIDKATLLENSVTKREHEKDGFTDSSSNPEISQELLLPGAGLKVCSMEDFEKLRSEKDALAVDLTRCMESLEQTKCLLLEAEKEITNLKLSLSDSEKSNSLAETQLKCMAESYKSLEARLKNTEMEIHQLQVKAEALHDELQQERQAHQVDLDRYKDLQENMERTQKALLQSESDNVRASQESEISAAAEKLAQCQETILLLGRQLKTMQQQQPHMDPGSPSPSGRLSISSSFFEDINSSNSASKFHGGKQSMRYAGHPEPDSLASILQRNEGIEPTPLDIFVSQSFPSENHESYHQPLSPISSKRPKHRSTLSSSSSSSIAASEKQSRGGFSRFFSKGKMDR